MADNAHKDKLYFVEKIWGAKNFDFRRATIFFLRHRLSEHKMTRYAKNLGGGPLGPLAMPMQAGAAKTTAKRVTPCFYLRLVNTSGYIQVCIS